MASSPAVPPPKPKSKRRKARERRIALFLVGFIAAFACKFLPEKYQGPCGIVAKIVGLLGGA